MKSLEVDLRRKLCCEPSDVEKLQIRLDRPIGLTSNNIYNNSPFRNKHVRQAGRREHSPAKTRTINKLFNDLHHYMKRFKQQDNQNSENC